MTINELVDIIFSTVNVSCGKENTGMAEESIRRFYGERVERAVDPYLKIGEELVPITILSMEEVKKLIAVNGPRPLFLAPDPRHGDTEYPVCFSDPDRRLETGESINPKGIIWQERKAIPSSI